MRTNSYLPEEWGGSRVAVIAGLCLALGAGVRAAPAPAGPNLDTDAHLVGWWKFDERSGKSAADASGQGHPAVLEGGLAFDSHSAPGRIGQALKCGGNEDCVRVTGFKGITGTKPRTIAAWIKTPTRRGDLIRWGKDEHGQSWSFGYIRGGLGVTPKGGYLYMKDPTADDAWHHVAVVVREADPPNLHDHVKLFRDGKLAEIDDIGLLDLWPIETGDQMDVCIGRKFVGLMDDLRLYDRALTEEEIAALFKQAGSPPPASK